VRSARDAYLGDSPDITALDHAELIRRMSSREVTLVDVRPELEYAAGHLPGAVNIPIEQLEERLGEVPADREVVAYCRGPYCVFAHEAVIMLQAHGRRAARLTDGVTEWRLAGLPVSTSAHR
jgi:rhodanese-related sulfurtransferase